MMATFCWFAFIFAFALSCVILTSMYVLIFITAYRRRRRVAQSNEIFCSAGGRSMYVKDLKNAKTFQFLCLHLLSAGVQYFYLLFPQMQPMLYAKMSNRLCNALSYMLYIIESFAKLFQQHIQSFFEDVRIAFKLLDII